MASVAGPSFRSPDFHSLAKMIILVTYSHEGMGGLASIVAAI